MGSSRTTLLARRSRKRRPALVPGAAKGPLRAVKSLAPALVGGASKHPLRAAKRPPWKLLGLAGIAGVAATGVVVARSRRAHRDLPPDELRERLHRRLAEAGPDAVSEPAATGEPAPPAAPG